MNPNTGSIQTSGELQRGRPQTLGLRLGKGPEVLEQNPAHARVGHHARNERQPANAAAQHQPIEPVQHTDDVPLMHAKQFLHDTAPPNANTRPPFAITTDDASEILATLWLRLCRAMSL